MFLRKSAQQRDPLPVTMSGVRRGERVLQVGVNDAAVACVIAQKSGLTGHAAIVVFDEATAQRTRAAVDAAGVLVDLEVSPSGTLPFPEEAFDVAIVHGADGLLGRLGGTLETVLAGIHRMVRSGGRVISIEPGSPATLLARLKSAPAGWSDYQAHGGTAAALDRAGFKPVRELADSEGLRFVEGFRR